ncbi:MAG: hypothetical protein ACHQEM_12035, partial [Chitinophagales bacterium]
MNSLIYVSEEKSILDVQNQFKGVYPFLNLEFYKTQETDPQLIVRRHLAPSTLLKIAGLKNPGSLEIGNGMTVAQIEKALREKFGLVAQVTRQSGTVWL